MGVNSISLKLLLWKLVVVLGVSSVSGVGNMWNFTLEDYRNHPCNRPCEDMMAPRLCHYDFTVENYYAMSKACYDCPVNQSHCFLPQCVTAGGARRVITTANRILPGPSIEVCEGDTIEVKVTNMLDGAQGTAIHWHGFLQHNSQHMDGVPMVTQCPVLMGSHFTYRFTAREVGTYFWHGHAGTQRADGLFGPLIVRQSPGREPHRGLYDYDLSEHVIIVNDWLTVVSVDRLAELLHLRENLHMIVLVNGMGQYEKVFNATLNQTYYTPRPSFTVRPGLRYRFRVINSGILNCPLQLSIDNHTMTIIASDGSPVQPVTRSSFAIHAGERYDFVLTTHNTSTPRNYWFRVSGLNYCTPNNVTQAAILKYQGAPATLPPEPLWPASGAAADDPAAIYSNEVPVVAQLVSIEPAEDAVLPKPDKKFYLDVDMVDVQNLRAYNPPYYTLESSALFQSPQINFITSVLPSAPPLTQLKDIPEEMFCNTETVNRDCEKEWCVCVHRYKVELGDLVELVILDDDGYHAMHLHGFKFRVVGYGKVEEGSSLEDLKARDSRGELNRTTGRASLKDTVAPPTGGYYIIRFIADNIGFWLFHCHLEFHMETGMFLMFQVGNPTQLPPRPKNFPVCGSWDFVGYEVMSSDSGCNCNSGATIRCNCCKICNVVGVCNCINEIDGGDAGNVNTASKVAVILPLIVASLLYFRRSY